MAKDAFAVGQPGRAIIDLFDPKLPTIQER